VGERDELTPGVSVVVITFQRPRLAVRLVEQLLHQEEINGPFEILVVNDNGGPEVFDRLSRLRTGGIPLRCFDTGYTGFGAALARNVGLRFARHETIVFLDDDVSVGPELVARYQQAPQGIRLGCVDFVVEIDGERRVYPDRRRVLMTGADRLIESYMPFLFLLWSANFCIPTAVGVRLGGFDEAFLDQGQEDSDFGARLIFATQRLVAVPSARAVHHGPDRQLRRLLGMPVTMRPERAGERLRARGGVEANGGLAYWRRPKWQQMIR
jgi:glycosyltransferase involved in cell wall biosynthesis